MIDLEKDAAGILEAALQNGGEFAEIFMEETARTSISFENNKVEKVITGTDVGAGIRHLSGDRTLYGHTNELSEKSLVALAGDIAGGARDERASYNFAFAPERFRIASKLPPAEVATPRKLELVRAANAVARDYDPRIVQVAVSYGDSLRHVVIVNSQGRFVEESRPQLVFSVRVVARDGDIVQTGYESAGGTLGFELFDEVDPETIALRAAKRACLMLEADPAPTGRMPVVLSSEAGGTMVHEAVGHGLEADHIDKGVSKYCGRLNEPIAVPEVTVIDDGTLPGKRGTANIDDEGMPTERTVLIDKGILVRFMNDRRTAAKMHMEPTGNGRRQSYRCKPIPRMTNTMVASGKANPAAILAETPKGLFVKKMGGGQVNPLNGDYVFEVSEGYLIRNGKAETPVRGATLIGNGPDTLMQIEAIGNDLGFAIGTCGKDGQGAPVSDAQPTLRIRELTIGGTG
ncbi:MAG: TldD/PmbA family protein [Candidatus Hydrogenedentota bacterium]